MSRFINTESKSDSDSEKTDNKLMTKLESGSDFELNILLILFFF